MSKLNGTNLPTIHRSQLLSDRAFARLETAAKAVHAKESRKRELQVVSTGNGFQCLFRDGKTVVEIQNDSFAVRQID